MPRPYRRGESLRRAQHEVALDPPAHAERGRGNASPLRTRRGPSPLDAAISLQSFDRGTLVAIVILIVERQVADLPLLEGELRRSQFCDAGGELSIERLAVASCRRRSRSQTDPSPCSSSITVCNTAAIADRSVTELLDLRLGAPFAESFRVKRKLSLTIKQFVSDLAHP